MTTIYLIRHSVKYPKKEYETVNAPDDKDIDDEKRILSVEGEKRAEILSTKHDFDNVDVIYTSNMVRTIQTAKYLATRLNKHINVDYRLNERRYGKQNSDDFEDWYERQYLYKDFRTEGGESQEDVRIRMSEILDEILKKHNGQTVAIFSHGYAITFLLLKWCKLISVNRKRELKYEFNNKILFNKEINAPEVFKLTFDNDKLLDIKIIEYDDIPYMHGGI